MEVKILYGVGEFQETELGTTQLDFLPEEGTLIEVMNPDGELEMCFLRGLVWDLSELTIPRVTIRVSPTPGEGM